MKRDRADMENTAESGAVGFKRTRFTILTACVIAAVIILNVIISVMADADLWYIDLTSERYTSGESAMYTLSDACRELVDNEVIPNIDAINKERELSGEKPIKLNIIFCTDRDYIEADGHMRYISMTARQLEKEYPEAIDVRYVNIAKNPSAVQRFKTTSASTIYESDVIVEFGSEYLIQQSSAFFYQDDGAQSPWAYNGEQKLSAMMLSLTRAESPICALTTNHGETLFNGSGEVKEEYSTFVKLIGGAGYDVIYLDLEKDEIPENCRMMICFDPQSDLKAYGNIGESGISEIEKLDKYLDGSNAFFYVCNRTTPSLPALEEYLEEWGVTVARVVDKANVVENYSVKDSVNCTDVGRGDVLVGMYGEVGSSGGITSSLKKQAYPPKVVFGSPSAVKVSGSYAKTYVDADEENGIEAYSFYSYYRNGVSRRLTDVFTSYSTATAYVGSEAYEIATELNLFKLMTITQESRMEQETNYTAIDRSSYVLSLASTEFFKNGVLDSAAYGNADVLLSALRRTSVEAVPANIRLKAFYVYDMDGIKTTEEQAAENKAWLICLSVIPATAALVTGTVVVVRRKSR